MKSISAAIVIAAGIYGITLSVPLFLAQHTYMPVIGLAASLVTLALGLVGWWASLKYDR